MTSIDNQTLQAPINTFSETKSRNSWIWKCVIVAVLSFFAIFQISDWPDRLHYPGEEDGAEGTQLTEMVHLRRGESIYRIPSKGAFDSAIYGPIYYLAGAAVINPVRPAYLPLRLLSLAGTICLLVMAALFAWKASGQKMSGIFAVLILLSTIFVARYGLSARADIVALAMSFAGFVWFANDRSSRRGIMGAAFLMLLSLFYKQQFVGAPVSVFLFLALERRFRAACEFAVALIGGAGVLTIVFSSMIFRHQSFALHFFSYNRLPFDRASVVPEILMFAIPLFVPLLGSCDFLDTNPDRLLLLYALGSSAVYFLLLFSSSSGADTNRCLEPAIALSCLFAVRIGTLTSPVAALSWTVALVGTFVLLGLLRAVFVVPHVTNEDFTADAKLQQFLGTHFPRNTAVLTYYPADPLRAGLEAPVSNLWHYSQLIRAGKISNDAVTSRIENGGYGLILLDFAISQATSTSADFYTVPSMRSAILHKYRLKARLDMPIPEITRFSDGHIYVWEPQKRPN